MKYLLSICIFAVLAPLSLWADVWEPFGLQGQGVEELVINPKNPETMYAIVREIDIITQMYSTNLLRTMDGGGTWESIKEQDIDNITVDPIGSDNIYVGSHDALFISRDGGETWEEEDIPPVYTILVGVGPIVFHPADPNVMYLLQVVSPGEPHLSRSEDGGENWTTYGFGPGPLYMDYDPQDPDVLYLCGMSGYYTVQGLQRWRFEDNMVDKAQLLPEDHDCSALAISPSHPNTIYVQVYDGMKSGWVFRSIDGGTTWEEYALSQLYSELTVSPTNPNLLYGIEPYNGELFISEDGGRNWRSLMDGMQGVEAYDLTFHPQRPWELYACTSNGIYVWGHSKIPARVSPAGKLSCTWGQIRLHRKPAP